MQTFRPSHYYLQGHQLHVRHSQLKFGRSREKIDSLVKKSESDFGEEGEECSSNPQLDLRVGPVH